MRLPEIVTKLDTAYRSMDTARQAVGSARELLVSSKAALENCIAEVEDYEALLRATLIRGEDWVAAGALPTAVEHYEAILRDNPL